jgi:hypothetical protein
LAAATATMTVSNALPGRPLVLPSATSLATLLDQALSKYFVDHTLPASHVHDQLKSEIERVPRDYWWQACVLIERSDRAGYFKTDTKSAPEGD